MSVSMFVCTHTPTYIRCVMHVVLSTNTICMTPQMVNKEDLKVLCTNLFYPNT